MNDYCKLGTFEGVQTKTEYTDLYIPREYRIFLCWDNTTKTQRSSPTFLFCFIERKLELGSSLGTISQLSSSYHHIKVSSPN